MEYLPILPIPQKSCKSVIRRLQHKYNGINSYLIRLNRTKDNRSEQNH